MLKAIGLTFLVAAVLALSAGIATRFWPTAPGTLERFQQERLQSLQPAGHVRGRHHRWRPPAKFDRVSYRYQVADVTYQGSWICLCLPIGVMADGEPGSSVQVRYFPPLPWISVLQPGPDGYLVAGLSLIGLALLLIGPAWKGLLRAARKRGDPWQHRQRGRA